MILESLKNEIAASLNSACRQGLLGDLTGDSGGWNIQLERPRKIEHGDFSCGVALQIAGRAGLPALAVAEALASVLELQLRELASIEVSAPGFLNFRVTAAALQEVLREIHEQKENFGFHPAGSGKRVLLRSFIAARCGKPELADLRVAVFGSCLANLLRACSFVVAEEILAVGRLEPEVFSLHDYRELFERLQLNSSGLLHFQEAAAAGAYLKSRTESDSYDQEIIVESSNEESLFFELSSCTESGLSYGADPLPAPELIYVQSGALLAGAGEAAKPGLTDAEKRASRVEQCFGEDMVGLVERLGADSLRFVIALLSPQSFMQLDPESVIACRHLNPAFLVPYTYSRCASFLRRAREPVAHMVADEIKEEVAQISVRRWQELQVEFGKDAQLFQAGFSEEQDCFSRQKQLAIKLDSFSTELSEAASTRQPGRIARYAFELAVALKNYLDYCCTPSAAAEVCVARLGFVYAGKIVLSRALRVLGLAAKDSL